MILRIVQAETLDYPLMKLEFNDGTRMVVNLTPLLHGEVIEPMRDSAYFVRAKLDPICGTVVWPNGADFAPEALRELPSVADDALAR